jgi:hypothetical protein
MGCILRFERLAAFESDNQRSIPMARLPASEATRKRIEAMISGEGDAVEKSELVRTAARLIVEEAHRQQRLQRPVHPRHLCR